MTTLTKSQKRATKTSKTEKQTKKVKAPKPPTTYAGAPIAATRAYKRTMPEFKNTHAECWILVNENTGTTTFANTYADQLKASYRPSDYCWPTNPSKLALNTRPQITEER